MQRKHNAAMPVGDCVIASSFVSYLGPFNKEFRELLFTRDFQASAQKLSISASPQLSVTTFLADQPEIGQWTLQVGSGHSRLALGLSNVKHCIRPVRRPHLAAASRLSSRLEFLSHT